jgi:hypothetical protein
MNIAEFIAKWSVFTGKEASAYQDHFSDLCRALGHDTPIAADPTGNDTFCFQKRVVKDAELFDTAGSFNTYAATDEERHAATRGFADVWLKGHFAWEYKGPGGDLEDAYLQLLRYRESLLNPPLLIVSDFHRFIIRTNFNGTVQQTWDIPLAKLDQSENLRVLRAVFFDPDSLRPERTTRQVTEDLADRIAAIARSLQDRESIELADTRTRREYKVAERKNLRIAQFLNRLTFCFFAEDVGLLPKSVFTDTAAAGRDNPAHFSASIESLFRAMSAGGIFGPHPIRPFNGHLFEDVTVFELTPAEIGALADAAGADWQFIDPTIFGTLFQRALEKEHRAELGAHYTSTEDIKTLLEPVLMAPLRAEWTEIKRALRANYRTGKVKPAARKTIETFLKRLRESTVLDPACGSGNFLYLALQLLLDLEKDVITFAARMGLDYAPQVDVQQLRAIEINPYAFELAQVSVQIGYLQWRRDNGYSLDRTPVLQTLSGFQRADALLASHHHNKPRSLKDAQAQEHAADNALKFYSEQDWPACTVIVGNPPFLGDKLMRRQLGDDYVSELRQTYDGRLPGQADFCCYWFEKARALIAAGQCQRAGLLATQNIRGLANRKVLERIKETGNIFWAESDRPWILDGANVHISMVGFDNGDESSKWLDGKAVRDITATLTDQSDVSSARPLASNAGLAFIGSCKGGAFDIVEEEAVRLLNEGGNPNGRPNSDVVRPVVNTDDLFKSRDRRWIIDNADLTLEDACLYQEPHKIVVERVKPHRDSNRDRWLKENWWRPQRMRPEMRGGIRSLSRFLITATTAKHQVFVWLSHPILPDHKLTVFAFEGDLEMGILQSRFHQIWSLRLGTRLETRPNYTPSTCFETFPFPPGTLSSQQPGPTNQEQLSAISAAAKELNDLRERWLNPPEWTRTETLEFPGTVGGPWDRYIASATAEDRGGFKVGIVRYPRIVARDADSAARLEDRTLTKLYNARPTWLADAHRRLDAAVSAAYGCPPDLADDQILNHLLALNIQRTTDNRTETASFRVTQVRNE